MKAHLLIKSGHQRFPYRDFSSKDVQPAAYSTPCPGHDRVAWTTQVVGNETAARLWSTGFTKPTPGRHPAERDSNGTTISAITPPTPRPVRIAEPVIHSAPPSEFSDLLRGGPCQCNWR